MKAIILCAGKATRLGLKKTPKCMAKINGKPILEHIVDHLNNYGITEIIVNLHIKPNKVMDYFGTRLLYSFEPEPLGVEKTILSLHLWLGDRFFVINGDTITNVNLYQMMRFYPSCRYIGNTGRFAGTEIVHFNSTPKDYVEEDAYYFDCGTSAKLAKARRFFKNGKL